MKNFSLFSVLVLNVMSYIILNAMDPAPSPKTETLKLLSADSVVLMANNQQAATAYKNNDYPPLLIIGAIPMSMSTSQLNTILGELAKSNPGLAQELNNPIIRNKLLQQLAIESTLPMPIPVSYLIDKKPQNLVLYAGFSKNGIESEGVRIAEKEGNKITGNIIYSSQKDDPSFLDEPSHAYPATERFCKEANREIEKFEKQIEMDERRIGFKHLMPGIKNSELADKLGVTSGWTGGKPLMDTEKRTPSSRPQ